MANGTREQRKQLARISRPSACPGERHRRRRRRHHRRRRRFLRSRTRRQLTLSTTATLRIRPSTSRCAASRCSVACSSNRRERPPPDTRSAAVSRSHSCRAQLLHRWKVQAITETGGCILVGAAFNGLAWLFKAGTCHDGAATRHASARAPSRVRTHRATRARISPPGDSCTLNVTRIASLHDVIYYGLLPPIIFEAGFTMRKHGFFDNFGTILLYAVSPPGHKPTENHAPSRARRQDLSTRTKVLGTMLAIIATGALVYALASAGAIASAFSFPQAMLFAALISSTDPVATLSILKRVKAQVGPSSDRHQTVIRPSSDRNQIVIRSSSDRHQIAIRPSSHSHPIPHPIPQPLLYDLIFGESALNDALSIAIFNVFRNQCAAC